MPKSFLLSILDNPYLRCIHTSPLSKVSHRHRQISTISRHEITPTCRFSSSRLSPMRCVSRRLYARLYSSLPSKPTSPPVPIPAITHPPSPLPAQTLAQRMKSLSREYGYSALGVYLLLSALDFPFCFLLVKVVGTERIAWAEHIVVSYFKSLVGIPIVGEEIVDEINNDVLVSQGEGGDIQKHDAVDLDRRIEKKERKGDASLWTQLALAYAVHKSLIFIRVPLTAAVTPKVVKTLRGWGWNIGKKKPKVE